jgi:hypothetical protein
MKTYSVIKHESNGMFYIPGIDLSQSLPLAVDYMEYVSLLEDHKRNLDLLKIILKANKLENFIKVE